ncbi:MAG TPA: hypothetical protein VG650_08295 [Mycobacteriales bacterium]|nr:hypothetical protein [Mycobacteriales bacterium]
MAKQIRLGLVAVLAFGLVGLASAEVASAASGRGAATSGTVVKLRKTSLGKVLVGPNGRSLYVLTADGKNRSHCNALCRYGWPPLMTSGKPRAGTGVNAAKLGQTANHQVTYHGKPLYYYAQDSEAGQTNGEGIQSFGGYWYLVNAKGRDVRPPVASGGGY